MGQCSEQSHLEADYAVFGRKWDQNLNHVGHTLTLISSDIWFWFG
jgi:hypothetical protein